jgi:S1-C subfamily serine protease
VLEQKTAKAIVGAEVEIEGTPPSLGIPIRNETKTDGEGRFSLAGLAEHNSGIQVSASGYHARIVSVPPIPDGEQRGPLRIELNPVKPGEREGVELTGIGAILEKSGEAFVVVKVVPQGGAAEVGIAEGDVVTSIDGRSTKAMVFGDLVTLIRGPEGTTVALEVQKGGNAQSSVMLVVPRRVVRG